MMDGNDESLWNPNLIFGLIRLRSYMGNLEIVHKKIIFKKIILYVPL